MTLVHFAAKLLKFAPGKWQWPRTSRPWDQRLTPQEEKVDSRLKETRSIREAVRAQIEKLDETSNILIRDLYDVRGNIGLHDKRLGVLERRII